MEWISTKLKKIKSPKYKVGDTIFNSKNNAESFVILSKDEYFYYGNNCSLLIPIADNEWKPTKRKIK